MKKFLLAGIAAAAFCAAPASAADMPVKAPVYKATAPVPYDPWTGCYIGANAGYLWGNKDTVLIVDNGAPVNFDGGKTHPDGWAYGGQIGCDFQFNTNWVVGIRGLWDGADATGSNVWPAPFLSAFSNRYNISQFATLVAKFGVLLNPTFELYGLGGLAWVRDRFNLQVAGVGVTVTDNLTRSGYDVGVGVSWIFAPHWDLFVEYDFMNFGTKKLNVVDITGNVFTFNSKQNVDKLLVGINYRFSGR